MSELQKTDRTSRVHHGGFFRSVLPLAMVGAALAAVERHRRAIETRAEIARAHHAERAHEARNALTAIEGATRALHADTEPMTQAERAALSAAVSMEIARLQRLIAGHPAQSEHVHFRLAEAIAAVVMCERRLGATIELDVSDDLVAEGSPASTAEVVQNLLQNARWHGSGPVQVRATIDDDEVVLRVRDHGRGIPAEDADVVFARGGRSRTGGRRPGSGLGLHIARELMIAQGGRLWLDDAEQDGRGGACFALALPGFSAAASTSYAIPWPLDQDRAHPGADRQALLVGH